MSVQVLSRVIARLALDAELLESYIPTYNDDDEDINESKRIDLVEAYGLTGTDAGEALASGDFNQSYGYLAANLEKPVPTGEEGSGGSGGSGGG